MKENNTTGHYLKNLPKENILQYFVSKSHKYPIESHNWLIDSRIPTHAVILRYHVDLGCITYGYPQAA